MTRRTYNLRRDERERANPRNCIMKDDGGVCFLTTSAYMIKKTGRPHENRKQRV